MRYEFCGDFLLMLLAALGSEADKPEAEDGQPKGHPALSVAVRPCPIPSGLSFPTLRPDIMGDVLTFTPRPKRTAPEALPALAGADLRASLEEAAQTAFDAADHIIAVLDRMDDDADLKDSADAEPSLAAFRPPKDHR
ncbi:hypothetical protein [Methylobacterium sp. 391_Methyba4]|uniref:hypothetical protein n=1 Tax=Methylobacterium sp. 391_Methyba4 TaxID=3038924 RepID=UPI00241EB5D6|nr:hypothetical protein [Methylobacterium sp. 391_Methyba4]WFS09696.1 hypothetical protein P9K36_10635 [Methylobacterium sp. 391_Methyba4]